MNRVWRYALIICVFLMASGSALVWFGMRGLDEPVRLAQPLRFKVASGWRFTRVASELAAQGVLANPRAWVLFARWSHLATAIKAGEYEIQPGTTPRELLTKMVSGQVLLHSFTIIDGWRVQDMLGALRRNPDIISTLGDGAQNLMDKFGLPGVDPEGQFLPETYRFVANTTDIDLLRQAHAALTKELDAAWMDRDPDLPLRDIRTVDLRTDGPYNTYTRVGLPPTPIALAGAAAIRATARPEKTDAIYFVASAKGDGSHVFSPTLEKHNAAVASYLARQRQKAAEAGGK